MPPLTRHLVFHGTHSSTVLMGHLLVVGLGVLLVFMLSSYERRLISRSLGIWLLGLRLAVLAVILLTLLQPTISWTLEKSNQARILVGIDISESMSTVDQHASQGEKLRVARGLEMIGNSKNAARLDRWQADFDSGEPPLWVDPDETDDESRRTALTKSRREHLQGVFAEIEKLARSEIAKRLLLSTQHPLLDQLEELGKVELFVFAGKSEPINRDALEKVLPHPPQSIEPDASNLSSGLQRGVSGDGDVLGIVLLTDGRDHSQQNLTAIASSLKAVHSPIYPIMVGSNYRPKDLAILFVEHPQVVYKGDHPQLKVTISTVGFEGVPIEVELASAEAPDSPRIRRSVTSTASSAVVEFDLDAEHLGRHSFNVSIPVQAGETREDNNSRSFTFSVVDDRAKVLLIEGEPRWEFRYLSTALGRDDRVDLRQILFEQPYLGVLPEPFFPRQLILPDDPSNFAASSFSDIDLVVVGDVSTEHFPEQAWETLLKFVLDGGTVILSAGKRDMPVSHRSAALEQLLPIRNATPLSLTEQSQEGSPRDRGLYLQLTADGEQQPMLQFAPDLAQNVAIWKGLPGQMWAILGEPKAGTTIWGTTQLPAGRMAGLNTDRKFGVMIHQFVGAGQVVWLGFDGTWRWRYRVGDQFHHRFWGQIARWAAANKLTAGNDFVRFGTEKASINVGQPASFKAHWKQDFLKKFPKLKAQVEVYRAGDQEGQPFTIVPLTPAEQHPEQHEGQVALLGAGEYRLRLVAEQATLGQKPIETTLFVEQKPSPETSDVSTNQDLLAQIAEASGGRLFLPDEVRNLPGMFQKIEETTTQYQELTLWDRWPLLATLFALLMAEWVLRKINGLP